LSILLPFVSMMLVTDRVCCWWHVSGFKVLQLNAGSVDARWLATLGKQQRALLMKVIVRRDQISHLTHSAFFRLAVVLHCNSRCQVVTAGFG
jgi:hypothetical protein